MKKASTVVALIGQSPGLATFVGVYQYRDCKSLTVGDWQALPPSQELIRLGHTIVTDQLELTKTRLLFTLQPDPRFSCYTGRLVLDWPPPEISWSRWAVKNEIRIAAFHPESIFAGRMPDWRELVVSWSDLKVLPTAWKQQLAQWRGIYYIFDVGLQKGYVGSAYGNENLLQRWQYYAKTGHGDNKRLLKCHPENFRFSILEWVDPSASPADVIERESSWKKRLHTKEQGLNAN